MCLPAFHLRSNNHTHTMQARNILRHACCFTCLQAYKRSLNKLRSLHAAAL